MKIVMFTPSAIQSAIGRVAKMVVTELLRSGHDVVVVRTESEVLEFSDVHDFGVSILAWTDEAAIVEALARADVAVYQVGDNFAFHEGCLTWMARHRGVVCLHDYFVGHLFLGWAASNGYETRELVQHWYGSEIADQYEDVRYDLEMAALTVDLAPMTEWIASQALGVISHSEWAAARVRSACPGPVIVSALPYVGRSSTGGRVDHQGPFELITIGHVNPNKRAASVIEAIGSRPMLRNQVVYTLAGAITPSSARELAAAARSHGVRLRITGTVDDDVLSHCVNRASAVVALRWPCLEGASASAVEAMLSGKPTIVSDVGHYAEIPDGCVIKIDHRREVESVADAIEWLLADDERAADMAERALVYASDAHRADRYAADLVGLSTAALSDAAAFDVIDEIRRTLVQWGAGAIDAEWRLTEPLTEVWSPYRDPRADQNDGR